MADPMLENDGLLCSTRAAITSVNVAPLAVHPVHTARGSFNKFFYASLGSGNVSCQGKNVAGDCGGSRLHQLPHTD